MQKNDAVLFRFFAVQAFYITIAVGCLAVPGFLPFIVDHWIAVAIVIVVLEALTVATLWLLHKRIEPRPQLNPFPDTTIDEILLRFAVLEDFEATEQVYWEWFTPDLSVNDADYRLLLARGAFVRVIESTYSSRTRRVDGMYAFWPISRETFEALVAGRLREKQLTESMVLSFSDPKAEVIYVPEILVSKSSGVGRYLLEDARSYLAFLLREHSNLKSIGAWIYTAVGLDLADSASMSARKGRWGFKTRFYETTRERVAPLVATSDSFQAVRRRDLRFSPRGRANRNKKGPA